MSNKISPVKLDVNGRVIPKNSKTRVDKWRVTVGKKITGGKKERRFFDTERGAKEWGEKKLAEKKEKGHAAFALADGLRHEVLKCLERLEPSGTSLTVAVEYYLKHANPAGGKRTVSEVVTEFLLGREAKGCKKTTLNGYKCRLGKLSRHWGTLNIQQLNRADLRTWIFKTEESPKSRNNMIGDVSNLFNYAVEEKYCVENPAKDIDRMILNQDAPGILSPAQAQNLLYKSVEEAPNLTAGLTISLFAGLRRSEICALDWSEVDLPNRVITITSAKAKTRKRRIVTISDNLALWLAPRVQKDGPVLYFESVAKRESPTRMPLAVDTYGKQLNHLVAAKPKSHSDKGRPAIVEPWPDNALRHSFGSYFYGKVRNENITAAEMGNSPSMVHAHYRELVKPAAIEEFWNITPPQEATNIIPMKATA